MLGNPAFGNRAVKQRFDVAPKFRFQRSDELRQTVSQTGDSNGLNPFAPGVLVVRRHGIDFFEQHLRSQLGALRGQFGATVPAKDSVANDRGGQSRAGDARK